MLERGRYLYYALSNDFLSNSRERIRLHIFLSKKDRWEFMFRSGWQHPLLRGCLGPSSQYATASREMAIVTLGGLPRFNRRREIALRDLACRPTGYEYLGGHSI